MYRPTLIIFLSFFVFWNGYGQVGSGSTAFDIRILSGSDGTLLSLVADVPDGVVVFDIDGERQQFNFLNGVAPLKMDIDRRGKLTSIRSNTGSLRLFHLSRKRNGPERRTFPFLKTTIYSKH